MHQLISVDMDLLLFILVANFLVSSFIGFILAWYLRGRYETWLWFKRGIYCDDCAPLVDRSKEQGGK